MRPTSTAGRIDGARGGTRQVPAARRRGGHRPFRASIAGTECRRASALTERQAGFTLMETLALLGVLALGALLVTPSLGFGTSPTRLAALAVEIAAELTEARSSAIAGNGEAMAIVDPEAGSLTVGTRRLVLPADVAFAVLAAGTCREEGGRIGIRFSAGGGSCGAVLRLARAERGFRVRVDWYSGHVAIQPL